MDAIIRLKVLDLKVSSIIFNSSICSTISRNGLYLANEERDTNTFFIKIYKLVAGHEGPTVHHGVRYGGPMEQMKLIVNEDQFIDFHFSPRGHLFVCVTHKELHVYVYKREWNLKKKILFTDDNAVHKLAVSNKHVMVSTALGIYVYTGLHLRYYGKYVRDIAGISVITITDTLMAYAKKNVVEIYVYEERKWKHIKKVVGNNSLYTSIVINDSGLAVFATEECELHTCDILSEGVYNTISIPNKRLQYNECCSVFIQNDTLIVSMIFDEKSAGSIWYLVYCEGKWRVKDGKVSPRVIGEQFGKKVSITDDARTLLVLSDRCTRLCKLE